MEKRVIVISFLLLSFMFVAFTSAACTNSNQTILKLYSSNNSHGALWSDASYTQDVCFDTLFGFVYPVASPHVCSGSSNLVLKLSAETNAHAEINSSVAFASPVSVCYGNLVCGNYVNSCPSESKEIVRLSAETNAHLSVAGQNPGNVYNNLICCRSLGVASWKDMTNQVIDSKDVNVNNSVILYVEGTKAGTPVTFQIFEKNAGAIGRTFTNTSDSNGRASVRWKITDSDVAGRARSEFYFNVTSVDLSVGTTSTSLYANNTGNNVPPKCAIISPVFGSIHPAGQQMLLSTNLNAEDPDSVVVISWKVVNETTNTLEANANGESYLYSATPGTKTIILNVTDDAGDYCYNSTAVSVFAPVASGQNPRTEVFAWINNPNEDQIIWAPDYRADYSASGSYAYNVTSNSCSSGGSLICVAGVCPSSAVECGGNSITVTGSSQSYSSLNFAWTFETTLSLASSGLGKYNGSRAYSSHGDKTIKVVVSYGSASDMKIRKFNLVSTCQKNGINNASVISMDIYGRLVKVDPITTSGACRGLLYDDPSDDCCPDGGWVCEDAVGGGKLCQQLTISAATCNDYNESTSCSSDRQGVGNNVSYQNNAPDIFAFYNCSNVLSSNGKNYIVVCGETHSGARNGCAWYNNSCWLNVSLQDQDETSISLPGCLYQSRLGECVGGYQNVTTYGESVGGNVLDCSLMNRVDVVLCGRTGVKLPFFGVIQFVIALLIIILVYYLIRKRFSKKTKHRKK